MTKNLVLTCCLLALVSVVAAQSFQYDIIKGGTKAGNCEIQMTQRGAGYLLTNNATVKEGSAEQKISEQIIVGGSWLPEDYRLAVEGIESPIALNVVFADGKASVSGKLGMGELNQTIDAAEVSVWSDRLSIASLLILLPQVDYSVVGQINEFSVLLPEKLEKGIVSITVTGAADKGYAVSGTTPGGWEFDAWFDPQAKYITKYTVKGGYEFVPAKEEQVKDASLPQGYNPLPIMIMEDEDFLERLEGISNLTGAMAFSFPPEHAERLYLNRFSQEFAGVISAGEVSGSIEVKKMGHKVTNTPDWPLYYDLRGVDEKYMMPERDIDSDDPEILDRAERTVKPAVTLWDAARAINLWVFRNVEYNKVSGSAAETFRSLEGDSRAKSLLCAALCRSVGIPARIVSGVLYAEGPTDHTWVEVYLGEEAGWGPMDPTLGEADKINAAHISIWLGAQVPPVFAKSIAFEGIETN